MSSAENTQETFWNMVDEFIKRANAMSEHESPGVVAAALLQAAARYSSFYVAGSSASRNDLKEDKEALIQDIAREFKKKFAANLEDYIDNYKIYLSP